MPGISFLFKKRFHPMRFENQKRVFIAEEKGKEIDGRDKEFADQVKKEKELQEYEGLGKAPELDPRASSLKFMYAAPGSAKDKKANAALLTAPQPIALDENGDDEAVRAFKQKLQGKNPPPSPPSLPAPSSSSTSTSTSYYGPPPSSQPPALSRAPPTEGSYTSSLSSLSHKPFNSLSRSTRCLRCGERGHAVGERACPLFGQKGSLDGERQRREDPMWRREREGESSDPEGEFLQTLSRREKKLLLRKLSEREGGEKKEKVEKKEQKSKGERRRKRKRSNSSSSSGSSSSSSSTSS